MTIQLEEFARKTFDVEAVRVTRENMSEVAEWCNGTIQDINPNRYGQDVCIKVAIKRPGITPVRQTMALAGDWVLKMKNPKADTFRVYTDKAFKGSFESKAEIKLF